MLMTRIQIQITLTLKRKKRPKFSLQLTFSGGSGSAMAPKTRSKGLAEILQPIDENKPKKDNENAKAAKKKIPKKRKENRTLWEEFENEVWQHHHFQFLQEIGGGSQARVFKVRDTRTDNVYAIKQIDYSSKNSKKYADQELLIHSTLDHPGIVALRGHYFMTEGTKKLCLCLILDYHPDTLLGKIKKGEGRPLSEAQAAKYTSELVNCLSYLHNKNIIHRDIKLANILLSADDSVKLADFGIATNNDEDRRKTIVGTPGYQAPEIDENTDHTDAGREILKKTQKSGKYVLPPVDVELQDSQYTTQVDLWSLGVTLHAMLTGNLPCEDTEENSDFDLCFESHIEFDIPNWLTSDCMDLLSGLLEHNPKRRLKLEEVKRHPWIKDRSQT